MIEQKTAKNIQTVRSGNNDRNIVDDKSISNILKHCNISYVPKNQSITYFRRFHRIIAHMDIYSIDCYDSLNFQQL